MKKIKGFPDYSIDEAGVIINDVTGITVTQSEQLIKGVGSGYMYVTIKNPSYYWKRIAVHRLVALAYVDNPDNLPEINHKDKIRNNNYYTNLEWCTHQDNIIHSFANGRTVPKGESHWLHSNKASISTKKLMSEAKKGVNHPKFKGFYMVKHFRYNSSAEAEKHTGINKKTIWRRCKLGSIGSDYYFVSV